ncbi:MAG TPA: peptidylprolyl isomerase [Allocoleopsis sp.]
MMIAWQKIAKTLSLCVFLITLSLGLSAGLPAGNAITDGKAILRYALPIDNKPVREMQGSLEDISIQLRGKRWTQISSDVKKVERIITEKTNDLLKSIPENRKSEAEILIEQIKNEVVTIKESVENKNKESVLIERNKTLDLVGNLEQLMVVNFPYQVPEKYSNLPQLKGRATIEMETEKGNITIVVDGYSAPVTAGNFVDLVQRGFYNGLPFTRAEESYVLQAGDPPGKEQGFIDPKTNKYRGIPLEVLVKGDKDPTYEITLEDIGRYLDEPVLPFSSFGALALARPESDVNGGSSQFFFFLFEPELTPAGRNFLDGRYAVFGYTIEGQKVLDKLTAGDKIISAKVVQGLENLVQPN